MKNYIIVAIVAMVIGGIVGYNSHSNKALVGAASATGTTNSTSKIFSKVMDLSTANSTTTSIQNNSGVDYAVTSSFAFCNTVGTSKTAYTGTGLANLIITGATTSAAVTGNLADYNSNTGTSLTIGTSTVNSYASSTAESALPGTGRIIPAGAYYTFSSNATNTASCTVGVNVISL